MPLFWAELDQARARKALRQAVYVLRKDLSPEVVESRGGEAVVRCDGEVTDRGEPLAVLRRVLAACRMPRLPGFPRLAGGLVGYLGYGTVRLFEEIPLAGDDPTGLPDMRLFAPRTLLAFDNVSKTLDIIVLARPARGEDFAGAQAEIRRVLERLRRPLEEDQVFPVPTDPPLIEPVIPRDRFEAMVSRVVKNPSKILSWAFAGMPTP